jgi:hypothetical protein
MERRRMFLGSGDDDCDVEFAADQQMLEIVPAILDDRDGDGRKGPSEARQQVRKDIARDERRHAERQLSVDLGRLVLQRAAGIGDLRQDPARMWEEMMPLQRQRHAMGAPLEESEAEIAFELTDRFRYRRLGDRQFMRRARDGAVLRDGDEVLDLAEGKGHDIRGRLQNLQPIDLFVLRNLKPSCPP